MSNLIVKIETSKSETVFINNIETINFRIRPYESFVKKLNSKIYYIEYNISNLFDSFQGILAPYNLNLEDVELLFERVNHWVKKASETASNMLSLTAKTIKPSNFFENALDDLICTLKK